MRLGGVIAVWSYALAVISPEIDVLVKELYEDMLGQYWPEQRRRVENAYQDIDFPFEHISMPKVEIQSR